MKHIEYIKCPRCNGSGRISGGKCYLCKSTGKVVEIGANYTAMEGTVPQLGTQYSGVGTQYSYAAFADALKKAGSNGDTCKHCGENVFEGAINQGTGTTLRHTKDQSTYCGKGNIAEKAGDGAKNEQQQQQHQQQQMEMLRQMAQSIQPPPTKQQGEQEQQAIDAHYELASRINDYWRMSVHQGKFPTDEEVQYIVTDWAAKERVSVTTETTKPKDDSQREWKDEQRGAKRIEGDTYHDALGGTHKIIGTCRNCHVAVWRGAYNQYWNTTLYHAFTDATICGHTHNTTKDKKSNTAYLPIGAHPNIPIFGRIEGHCENCGDLLYKADNLHHCDNKLTVCPRSSKTTAKLEQAESKEPKPRTHRADNKDYPIIDDPCVHCGGELYHNKGLSTKDYETYYHTSNNAGFCANGRDAALTKDGLGWRTIGNNPQWLKSNQKKAEPPPTKSAWGADPKPKHDYYGKLWDIVGQCVHCNGDIWEYNSYGSGNIYHTANNNIKCPNAETLAKLPDGRE